MIPAAHRRLVEEVGTVPRHLTALAGAAAGVHPPPGEWSAHDVVRHLVAVERVVWQPRFRDLASATGDGEPPFWPWTQPDLEPSLAGASLQEALDAFAAARAATVEMATALDEGGWKRYGIHAVFGRLDVAGLLSEVLRHDQEHLAQLEVLAATVRR
jgi:hypothetical protein